MSQWRRHQLDGASKLSKLVDHEHPEISFSRHLRCWECLDQRSTTDPNRCGKRCCGSWPGSILSIRSMPATAPSSGPARFDSFITVETGGLGPQAVPNLRMSVPNGNQIAPTATKTHCCACGFEICVPVEYTGTQGPFSSRRAALLWSESPKSKSLQKEWRLERRKLLVVLWIVSASQNRSKKGTIMRCERFIEGWRKRQARRPERVRPEVHHSALSPRPGQGEFKSQHCRPLRPDTNPSPLVSRD